jgi:antitoxin component of MazEF toxin-antitoxin module
MKVAKWGDSLAVRLPAPVVQVLGLKEGTKLKFMSPARVSSALRGSQAERLF